MPNLLFRMEMKPAIRWFSLIIISFYEEVSNTVEGKFDEERYGTRMGRCGTIHQLC
jgi:hypothetical protein